MQGRSGTCAAVTTWPWLPLWQPGASLNPLLVKVMSANSVQLFHALITRHRAPGPRTRWPRGDHGERHRRPSACQPWREGGGRRCRGEPAPPVVSHITVPGTDNLTESSPLRLLPCVAPEKLAPRGCSKWAPPGLCSRQLDAVLVRRRPSEGQGLLRARRWVWTTVSLTQRQCKHWEDSREGARLSATPRWTHWSSGGPGGAWRAGGSVRLPARAPGPQRGPEQGSAG